MATAAGRVAADCCAPPGTWKVRARSGGSSRAAAAAGVGTLTLYAFSSDNWGRPPREVAALLKLFRRYLLTETERCQAQQVRLNIIGRRDRLGPELLRAVEHGERQTAHCTGMHLRMAVDYSARHSILKAAAGTGGEAAAALDEFTQFSLAPECGESFGTGAGRRSPHPHRRRSAPE